jgi:hypothetical protein
MAKVEELDIQDGSSEIHIVHMYILNGRVGLQNPPYVF